METKQLVLETMKRIGLPTNATTIAKESGLDKKLVDKAMTELKKENSIISPKRCYWEPNK